jgi:hypothetical protein
MWSLALILWWDTAVLSIRYLKNLSTLYLTLERFVPGCGYIIGKNLSTLYLTPNL